MKLQWDIEERIEYFTLVEEDLAIAGNKTGSGRLGCALLLRLGRTHNQKPSGADSGTPQIWI